jgi:hypothetical protein
LKKSPVSSIEPSTQPASAANSDLQEQIRTRAYELYEKRGEEEGNDVEDWLTAEIEILGKTGKS